MVKIFIEIWITFLFVGIGVPGISQMRTIISGYIGADETGYPIQCIYWTDFIYESLQDKFRKVQNDKVEAGFFRFEIFVKEPSYFSLNVFTGNGEVRLGDVTSKNSDGYSSSYYLIMPGDSIHIDFSGKIGYVFSGKGAEKFRYREEISKVWASVKEYSQLFHSEGEYFGIDSLKSTGLRILDKYSAKITPEEFLILKADLLGALENRVLKSTRSITSKNREKKELADKRFRERVLKFEPDFAFSDTISKSFWYMNYLLNRIFYDYYIIRGKFYPDSTDKMGIIKAEYHLINAWYKGSVKEKIITRFLLDIILTNGVSEEVHYCIKDYLANNKNALYRKDLEGVLMRQKNALAKGTRAFNFSLPDTGMNRISLTDFKGKIILLDFWFTGCLGCKKMTPFLESVKQKFKNRSDVVFINVSIDVNKLKWISSVRAGVYGASGVSLYTDGMGDRHSFIRTYNIISYPRLILIDRKGNLYNGHAPDPRRDNGKALIQLIKEAMRVD